MAKRKPTPPFDRDTFVRAHFFIYAPPKRVRKLPVDTTNYGERTFGTPFVAEKEKVPSTGTPGGEKP